MPFFCILSNLIKMQIPTGCSRQVLAIQIGLATTGVCVFLAVTSVAAFFIFQEVNHMAGIKLASNEGIIIQSAAVMSGSVWAAYTDELILTNLNVILVKRGMFGNKKSEKRFPVSQIKRINGKPQAILGPNSLNGADQLHITFMHGVEWFEFQSGGAEEINRWIKAIYELFHCTPELPPIVEEEPEVGVIESTLKKGVDSIKRIFGVKPKSTSSPVASSEPLNIRCPGCKAPLTGKPGEVVQCPYCDTKHRF